MDNIKLCKMTKTVARRYFKGFETDPVLFMDMSKYQPYVYSEERADAYYERQIRLGREYLAILADEEPIGEIILKNIDPEKRCCTLSIHLQNDSVKNKGYGTQAEILALEYAFKELGTETVYADAVLKNRRSQHVLEKVGFTQTHSDETFRYYRCDKANWQKSESDEVMAEKASFDPSRP